MLSHKEPRLQPLHCAPPLAPARCPAISTCTARCRHTWRWSTFCAASQRGARLSRLRGTLGQDSGWASKEWRGKETKHFWLDISGQVSIFQLNSQENILSYDQSLFLPTISFHPINHTLFPKTLTAWLPKGRGSPQHELHSGHASLPASFSALSLAHAPQSASTIP